MEAAFDINTNYDIISSDEEDEVDLNSISTQDSTDNLFIPSLIPPCPEQKRIAKTWRKSIKM